MKKRTRRRAAWVAVPVVAAAMFGPVSPALAADQCLKDIEKGKIAKAIKKGCDIPTHVPGA